MRISDWSSDVCSSDLPKGAGNDRTGLPPMTGREVQAYAAATVVGSPSDSVKSYFGMRKISTGIDPKPGKMALLLNNKPLFQNGTLDRKRVGQGKSVSGRVERGGGRNITKKKKK